MSSTPQLFYLNESDKGRLDLIAEKSGGGNQAAAFRLALRTVCDDPKKAKPPKKIAEDEFNVDDSGTLRKQFRVQDDDSARIDVIAKWIDKKEPNSSAAVRYAIRKTAKQWEPKPKKTKAAT